MRVIGLDLSLTATGVAVLEPDTQPTLLTIKSKGVPAGSYPDTAAFHAADLVNRDQRICIVASKIMQVVRDPVSATLVVLEGRSYASQGNAVWDIAWLWGFVAHRIVLHGVPVAIAAPSTVKKWATGKGNAGKTDVAAAMTRLWPDVTPANDNEFDALAMATMGVQHLVPEATRLARHAEPLAQVWWPVLPATRAVTLA